MTTLYIVPCSSTKSSALLAGRKCRAGSAYAGQAFLTARAKLEASGAKWCILSGLYGFLWPDTVIENYNQKMEPVTPQTVWFECFDSITQKQYGRLRSADRIVVLGSRLYADAARQLLGREVEAPLAGLPIGKMLQALKNLTLPQIESPSTVPSHD